MEEKPDAGLKELRKINDRTLLEWHLTWLRRYGVTKIIFACYNGVMEDVRRHFGTGITTEFGSMSCEYHSVQKTSDNQELIDIVQSALVGDRFILSEGNVFSNADLTPLFQTHDKNRRLSTFLLTNMTSPYGVAVIDDDLITEFIEKPRLDLPIYAGLRIVERRITNSAGHLQCTLSHDFMRDEVGYHIIPDSAIWLKVSTEKDFVKASELTGNKIFI